MYDQQMDNQVPSYIMTIQKDVFMISRLLRLKNSAENDLDDGAKIKNNLIICYVLIKLRISFGQYNFFFYLVSQFVASKIICSNQIHGIYDLNRIKI